MRQLLPHVHVRVQSANIVLVKGKDYSAYHFANVNRNVCPNVLISFVGYFRFFFVVSIPLITGKTFDVTNTSVFQILSQIILVNSISFRN